MSPETKFEFEPMTEPEANPEWAHPLPDSSDWDSLTDVPFAGDLLDTPETNSEILETNLSGLLD